jgi:hypothetical protein
VLELFRRQEKQAFEKENQEEEKKMKRFTTGLMAVAMVVGTASAAFAGSEVGWRQGNQQARIGQGVKNGSLTAGETSRLEGREANLNQTIRADRQANGGKLTSAERAQVNQRQNRISGAIYRDKHNAFHQ